MNRLVTLALGALLLVAGCGSSTPAAPDGGGGGGQTGAGGASGTAGTGGGGGAGGGSGGTAGGAACSAASTEAECDALSACHAIFDAEPRTPVGTCTCPDFGCCTHFRSCASGSFATCSGTVLCKIATPYCESGYAVANDGSCYVGCVKSSACAP
jgi:hypothetical protein